MIKITRKILVFLYFIFVGTVVFTQNYQAADSILRVTEQSQSDSVKMINYNRLSEFYRGLNQEKQLFYANKVIFHANQIDNTFYAIFGKLKRAVAIFDMGENENALKEIEKVLQDALKFNDSILLTSVYNQYGVFYRQTSNFSKAMECFMKAIKISETKGLKRDAAGSYNNVAIIYNSQGDVDKALEYFYYALNVYKEDENKTNYAKLLVNVSIILSNKKEYSKALEMAMEALEIWDVLDKKAAIGETYNCIAQIYEGQGDWKSAFRYYNKSLEIRIATNNKRGIAESYGQLGDFYYHQNQNNLAIPMLEKSASMAKELSMLEMARESHAMLYKIYKEKNDYKSSLENLILYMQFKDSLFNTENLKSLEVLKNNLENEKRERELEFANVKIKNNELALNKQKQRFVFLIGISVLLVCIVVLIVFQQIKSKRINKILNEKNLLIESKNKSITDSIVYAKRIQGAILPPYSYVKSVLSEVFIFYQPKDIVAGDFYWVENLHGGVYFAVADCTGHGVPGAMVSVVCNNALNRAIREYSLSDPGKILDKTREIVIAEFEKSEDDVKDGMDIALCVLKGKHLSYAGAHNPLWIIRKESDKIEEINANKQPIGKFDNPLPYTTSTVTLQTGDSVYIFSDGFADQFGGENGKKFKTAKVKELLLGISSKSMEEQHNIIAQTFETWKGALEQTDDVCVFGVRI